jgi:putative tryptophan/tyrosine transport system substrate-binding protein
LIGVLCADFCRAFSLGELVPEGRAFKGALQALGYVDGQNILLDYGGAGVPSNQLTRYAERLVRRNATVVLAIGLAASRVARTVTQTIPIVMVDVPEAVEFGVVDALARPGRNITGVTTPLAGLATKQLELLKEAVPGLARVAVLSNPVNAEHEPARKALQAAAVNGIALHFLEARSRSHEELDRVFTTVAKAGAGALLVLRDQVLFGGAVTLFAIQRRIPTISTSRVFTQGGGLMSYGPDEFEILRSAATYIDKLLKGRKPADLPVERPSRFAFGINWTTAKAIGLMIPPSLLLRADEVIE